MKNEIYNKDYFEDGIRTGKSAYENYRWLPKRTYREARAMINHLGLNPRAKVLDFGAAKGYMVRAFREYNLEAFGVDISDYALDNCDQTVWKYLSKFIEHKHYDAIISRNTLEHLEEEDLRQTLSDFRRYTDLVFFSVPLVQEDGGDYIIPIAELDKSHRIRWTIDQWIDFCSNVGWKEVRGNYKVKGIHEGWEDYPKGIGFFTLMK